MVMVPWLHFGGGDFLLFRTWQPSSTSAIVGACIALFVFCILERGLAALRRSRELYWRSRALALVLNRQPSGPPRSLDSPAAVNDCKHGESSDMVAVVEEALPSTKPAGAKIPIRSSARLIPPFIPSHDVPRGIIQAVQSMFSYVLMLAVMTFNAEYIISIVVGLGVGEILFGRIGHLQGGLVR
ncbi:Ctr copper transporter [Phlebopus sp. FC_14]|nr:Ctr copper transporter [Phlebopus sp. FC_14]